MNLNSKSVEFLGDIVVVGDEKVFIYSMYSFVFEEFGL